MGCGASQSDVIKSVVPKNSSDQLNKKRGSNVNVTESGGASKEASSNGGNGTVVGSTNSSVLSEGSTIPANEFYKEGPELDFGTMSGPLKPLPRSLPPLKPPRGPKSGTGFTDQNTNDSTEVNKNSRIGK
jgi:hypothetical protein